MVVHPELALQPVAGAAVDRVNRKLGGAERIRRLFGQTHDVEGLAQTLFVHFPSLTEPDRDVCQSARKTDPLSASKIDPPCAVEIRA